MTALYDEVLGRPVFFGSRCIFEYFISSIVQHCSHCNTTMFIVPMFIVHIQSSLARPRGLQWRHYSGRLRAKRQTGSRGTAPTQGGFKPPETEEFWSLRRHEFSKFATLLNILQKC